ncbi:hypothetical protein [Streptomyces sp. NPDC007988]|uniref:hypothetical protein n=1 Tax=Streptomyces sp. NPDC007988 TaxID=3364802 RepID=UPI0036E94859
MRAVKALLFVGGLVVLGFVLGGQAHAEERPGVSTATSQAGSAGPVRQLRDDTAPVAGAVVNRAVRPVSERVARDVVRPVAEPVVDQAVRPVAETVEDTVTEATEPVGDVVGRVVEDAAAQPWPAPGPGWPGEEPRPLSGLGLPDGSAQYGPGTGVPAGPRPAASLVEQPADEPSAGTAARSGPGGVQPFRSGTPAPADAAHGDRPLLLDSGLGDGPFPHHPGRSPAAPHGAAVMQTAGDSHTPRPGDQPAAWFRGASASALLPGSGQPEAASGPRERGRKIPEFPG